VKGWRQVWAEKQAVDGSDPHGGHRYVREIQLCFGVRRVSRWMEKSNYLYFVFISEQIATSAPYNID
jgi:hypothetical protein